MKNCNSATAAKKPSLDSGFGAEAPAMPTNVASSVTAVSGGGMSKNSSALEVHQLRTVRGKAQCSWQMSKRTCSYLTLGELCTEQLHVTEALLLLVNVKKVSQWSLTVWCNVLRNWKWN